MNPDKCREKCCKQNLIACSTNLKSYQQERHQNFVNCLFKGRDYRKMMITVTFVNESGTKVFVPYSRHIKLIDGGSWRLGGPQTELKTRKLDPRT